MFCIYCDCELNKNSFKINEFENDICVTCYLNINNIKLEKIQFENLALEKKIIFKMIENTKDLFDLIFWYIQIENYEFYLYTEDIKNYYIIRNDDLLKYNFNEVIIKSEKDLKNYLINFTDYKYIKEYKFSKIFKSASFNNYNMKINCNYNSDMDIFSD